MELQKDDIRVTSVGEMRNNTTTSMQLLKVPQYLSVFMAVFSYILDDNDHFPAIMQYSLIQFGLRINKT